MIRLFDYLRSDILSGKANNGRMSPRNCRGAAAIFYEKKVAVLTSIREKLNRETGRKILLYKQGVLDDGVDFIQKPFSMADMTEKVREVLDMPSDKN